MYNDLMEKIGDIIANIYREAATAQGDFDQYNVLLNRIRLYQPAYPTTDLSSFSITVTREEETLLHNRTSY